MNVWLELPITINLPIIRQGKMTDFSNDTRKVTDNKTFWRKVKPLLIEKANASQNVVNCK